MSYFESSVRVPLLISNPKEFIPHRVTQNVSTLDILPTMCDFVGTKPLPGLPMDGLSLVPHCLGKPGHDTVIAEYTGEGTVSPLMMIRRGKWKFTISLTDGSQLFNLQDDPLELVDLAKIIVNKGAAVNEETRKTFLDFLEEAAERWDLAAITKQVLTSQRRRKLVVWPALKQGKFESWDHNPIDDGRNK